ncbi:MAG TPA: hypothetical protein VLT92_11250 [Burkholderiales bacterium]|nr:hypothetical protein [Burkholderiales bacterium]
MNVYVLNASLLIGWLMVLIGGCMVNLAWGLVGAGALLLVLSILSVRLAGIYLPRRES